MPDYSRYCETIQGLWETRHLTDNGKHVIDLEEQLKEYLRVSYLSLLANGTLAIQIALSLFDFEIGSHILTTPFSYIATSSALLWEKCIPVFVDIDAESYNLSISDLAKKITKKTKAILAVHSFGCPCEVEKIDALAKEYGLKVIYDAAHAFAIEYKGKSILNFGDASTLSFQATKVFHTVEGGAIIVNNRDKLSKANQLKYFGYKKDKSDVVTMGTNAKMNEFQAIMGLLNLELVDEWILKRKALYELYWEELKDYTTFQKLNENITRYNYIYMPVLFGSHELREKVYERLVENQINPRKYFYPIINKFSYYQGFNQDTPVALDISARILHLPLYPDLQREKVLEICSIIKKAIR